MTTARFNARTHIGRVREVNEDSILALPELDLWIVSDGMGGHQAGDFASATICDSVATLDPALPPGERLQHLRGLLAHAHDAIRAEAHARGDIVIGATVVTLMLAGGHFVALWAGDSRLYLLRDGEIRMLSSDHSVVADLVHAGQLNWDEAEHHPQSNAITRAVGVGEVLELDKVQGELQAGDRFLLCSDGLTKYAGFALLTQMLAQSPLETVANRLVQHALDGGGADNISVIVVDID